MEQYEKYKNLQFSDIDILQMKHKMGTVLFLKENSFPSAFNDGYLINY